MKNRIKAILLAAGLTVSAFGAVSVSASEAVSESVSAEAVTEAVSEAAEEQATEAAAVVGDDAEADQAGAYAQIYDTLKANVPNLLSQLSAMTDEQLESLVAAASSDPASASIAASWMQVKEELGAFVEVTDQTVTEEGSKLTVVSNAKYDGVNEKTEVVVTYDIDMQEQTTALAWEINYPMSTLVGQAGLNTLMGVGIVFLVLLFLSFLIRQMHWIPDIMNRKENAKKAAEQAAPAPVQAAPVVEEEDLMDDGELIAVIAAAIAASEQTSTDGFVVRSIRKANKKNWQNA